MNNFRELQSSRQLYTNLRSFLAEHRSMELRDMYKEVGTWNTALPVGMLDRVDDPVAGFGGGGGGGISAPGTPHGQLYQSRHF